MRIVIGEDEALLREGLVRLLTEDGFTVVATAADAVTLVEQAARHEPDLVLTDIRMPPDHTDDGLRAALEIHRVRPATAIVVLSQHVQRRYAAELLSAPPGARRRPAGHGAPARARGVGYLLKQRIADIPTFRADLRRVAAGATVLDPEVVALLVARAGHDDALTARQREVLALMAEGRSNAAIARRLSISEKAVIQHASRVYAELGLLPDDDDHRRVLAVLHYLAR